MEDIKHDSLPADFLNIPSLIIGYKYTQPTTSDDISIMKTFFLLFALLVVCHVASADNIFLRNGLVYRNIKADTTGVIVVLDLITEIDTVKKSSIMLIEWSPVTNENPYVMLMTEPEKKFIEKGLSISFMSAVDTGALHIAKIRQRANSIDEYSRDHTALIPALLLFLFATEELDRAAGYTSAMEDKPVNRFFHPGEGLPNYKKLRTQAYILGAVAAVFGAALTIHTLLPVTISASPNAVNIGYNF
jgi:hypothetical protein